MVEKETPRKDVMQGRRTTQFCNRGCGLLPRLTIEDALSDRQFCEA